MLLEHLGGCLSCLSLVRCRVVDVQRRAREKEGTDRQDENPHSHNNDNNHDLDNYNCASTGKKWGTRK